MQSPHSNRSTVQRPVMCGLIVVLTALMGIGAARAARDWHFWGVGGDKDRRLELSFSDPFQGAELFVLPSTDLALREEKFPLITPRSLTQTPATPGSDVHCLSLLASEGVSYEEGPPSEGITTPVEVKDNTIGGVFYRYYFRGRAPRLMDCRLALALARAAPVLRANGVTEVIYANHYRPSLGTLKPGKYHDHAQGLAMDIKGFKVGARTRVSVEHHYETGLGFMDSDECLGRPMTVKGLLLRKIACDLDDAGLFRIILTPDYDRDHWNHFHVAAFHLANHSLLRPRGTSLLEVPITDLTGWAMRQPVRQRPELRPWDDVAARPWPEKHRWIRAKLGLPERPTAAQLAAELQDAGGGVLEPLYRLVGVALDTISPELLDAVQGALAETPFLLHDE